jgi:CHAT domain-containing protein/tetratricopeptide (TPR) repeat protein
MTVREAITTIQLTSPVQLQWLVGVQILAFSTRAASQQRSEPLSDGPVRSGLTTCLLQAFMLFAAALVSGLGCSSPEPPSVAYNRAYRSYVQGDFIKGREQAQKGYDRFADSNPQWAVKFEVLEAEILVFAGRSEEALSILSRVPSGLPADTAIDVFALRSAAQARLHRFEEAESNLAEAVRLCTANVRPPCGGVQRAQGFLAEMRGELQEAAAHFLDSLEFARAHHDNYLETTALLNLGLCAMRLHHFDEAIDWLDLTRKSAADLGAGIADTKAIGNLGWAYYSLGDLDQSLAWTLQAKQRAIELHDGFDELAWEMNAGQVYAAQGDTARAEQSFSQALGQARALGSKQDIGDALTVLAALGLQTGNFEKAQRYSEEALTMARADKNHQNELDPLLVQGTVAARTHDSAKAISILNSLIQDPAADDSLKWESQYALAKMYEDIGQDVGAQRSYNDALTNFERARSQISNDELRLPFLTNAARIYEDYVQFLAGRGKPSEALAVADFGRAQTLAEGLGLLKGGGVFAPPMFDPRLIARRRNSTILFYALASKQSYLWAITGRDVRLFTLPPAAEIDEQVQRYRKTLSGPRDAVEGENTTLFATLLAPALPMLPPGARVVIIPDGSLNTLNFETLVAPTPAAHYWIEDATVVYASSLRMLAGTRRGAPAPKERLLLMGDAVLPADDYRPLPHAKIEMDMVGKHFEKSFETVLARDQPTPAAYLSIHPERFAFLHFVTHGTANRLSPLDSAVILSRSSSQGESYKLYAREILQHPLQAELVTISSCYGSGSRTYSGEGLVGLSWAFLRAGSHHVIGALWEVSDDSTPQLMDTLYGELAKGTSAEDALHTAKLSLLHSGSVFRKPFYWGPFQLYTGP